MEQNSISNRCTVIIDPHHAIPCNECATLSESLNEINSIYCQRIENNSANVLTSLHIYSQWCTELSQQNQELINCIEHLEIIANNRLVELNEMHLGGNRMRQLKNDVENLVELIQRKQRTNSWNTAGLVFYDARISNIFSENLPTNADSINLNVGISASPYVNVDAKLNGNRLTHKPKELPANE